MSPAARIVVALDRSTTEGNLALVGDLQGRASWFKVGLREFYTSGAVVIDAVRAAGARLFLDVKLHDIPETVRGAMSALARHTPDLVTVHASGGAAMVRAAVEAAGAGTRVVAVTLLTSLDETDLEALGVRGPAPQAVDTWARLALGAGADGLVCAPLEVGALRAAHPPALLITPGVRPSGAVHGDQKRVLTPRAALGEGADLLVIGRPIASAADVRVAFDAIAAELAEA